MCANVQTDNSKYYSAVPSLHRHVVSNVLVSCKSNGDRNQMGVAKQ